MENKILLIVFLIIILTGCGIKYPELENNAIEFQASSYVDDNDDDTEYLTINYNGRIYMPYATLKGVLREKDLDKCIGYIIQDENISSIIDKDSKDIRVYTLSEDKDNNYLMINYIESQIMLQPSFYRAVDTKGKEIYTPKFIDSLDYNYWK